MHMVSIRTYIYVAFLRCGVHVIEIVVICGFRFICQLYILLENEYYNENDDEKKKKNKFIAHIICISSFFFFLTHVNISN